MNRSTLSHRSRTVKPAFSWMPLALGAALSWAAILEAAPSRILHPSPGGINPRPVILSSTNSQGRIQASGAGYLGGPFQVEFRTNAVKGTWQKIGPVHTNNYFTIDAPVNAKSGFFRVSAPSPAYGGAESCGLCHSVEHGGVSPRDTWYNSWAQTPHAKAFFNLTNLVPTAATNASCLPCHTVGFGVPGGFTAGNTLLQGVQCESCHGPSAPRHSSSLFPEKRPVVEWSSKLCGGCHAPDKHPAYTDWLASSHAEMTSGMASRFNDPVSGMTNLFRCGPCHSGAVRSQLAFPWVGSMPTADAIGHEGVGCIACHDPHSNTPHGHQLRNPLSSTNAYSMRMASDATGFIEQYNPKVNLCGQCHNARGAAYTDTQSPPHPSHEYNILTGTIGEMENGKPAFQPGPHALAITNQCIGCHMVQKPYESKDKPAVTGHSFAAAPIESCRKCHSNPEMLVNFATTTISNRVSTVKYWLDYWATTKAPEALRAKYGTKAWEYTRAGGLSGGGQGPTTADQAQIPANIMKARFNLYLVYNDHSRGSHNSGFSIALLDAAGYFIQQELMK